MCYSLDIQNLSLTYYLSDLNSFFKTSFFSKLSRVKLLLNFALKPGIGCSAHARTTERIIFLMPCFVQT